MALWLSGPFGALFLALSPPDPVTPACLDPPCFISLDAGLRPRSPVLKAFFPLVWNSAPLIFLTLLLAWPLRVLLLDCSLHIGNSFVFSINSGSLCPLLLSFPTHFFLFWLLLQHLWWPPLTLDIQLTSLAEGPCACTPQHVQNSTKLVLWSPFPITVNQPACRQSDLMPERHLCSSILFHPTLLMLPSMASNLSCLETLLPAP